MPFPYIMYYGQKFNRFLPMMGRKSIDALPIYCVLRVMYYVQEVDRFLPILGRNSIDSFPLWAELCKIPSHYGQKFNRFPSHILCIMYNVLWQKFNRFLPMMGRISIDSLPIYRVLCMMYYVLCIMYYGQKFNRFSSHILCIMYNVLWTDIQ